MNPPPSSPPTEKSNKVLNPKAKEWRPEQITTTEPPSSQRINIPVLVVFYPISPLLVLCYEEPVKPLSRGGATSVDITDVEDNNKAIHKKTSSRVAMKELVKRPKGALQLQGHKGRYPGRSFHHVVEEICPSTKAVWKPKGSNPHYTTVMIKNIPNRLRRDFLLKFMDQHCKEYALEYDFLYLPMDFRTGDNLGYAFVNFTNSVCASTFKDFLQGFKWSWVCGESGPLRSKKICNITWARIQGREALLKRFKGSRFDCDQLDYFRFFWIHHVTGLTQTRHPLWSLAVSVASHPTPSKVV